MDTFNISFSYISKKDIVGSSADSLMSSQRIHVSFWKATFSHVKVGANVPI